MGSSLIHSRACTSASHLLPVASLCIHSPDPRFNSKFAALHRRSPPSPEPPSAGESVAVDVVLSVGRVHHPPTRKDMLKLLVHSDLPVSPWFDAGDHRSLRAPANFFKPDMWTPLSASILFPPRTIFCWRLRAEYVFPLGWRVSFRSVFCFLS